MAETDTVPGMAEAIERRRLERGLSPGAFARAAGVTPEGLRPVRRGERRAYQDKVRIGVARALDWPDDALDRLMAGDDPSTFKVGRSAAVTRVDERLGHLEEQLDAVRKELAELAELAKRRLGDGAA